MPSAQGPRQVSAPPSSRINRVRSLRCSAALGNWPAWPPDLLSESPPYALRANPRWNREPERGAALIARGDPDPSAERALHHQAAQVQPQTQSALGAAAAGGTRLLERSEEHTSELQSPMYLV